MRDTASFDELLAVYYRHLFPLQKFCDWLSYGGGLLERREMSFVLANDIYIRFQSFKDAPDLRKELLKKCPHKIDIGAVYNFRPRDRGSVALFEPVQRELVFDIDMTDYDDIRTCCSGADICGKCWRWMSVAVRCLDSALRDDFGFNHLLWVFSGRRGVHCWVCDESARHLTASARAAVAEYLQIVRASSQQSKKVSISEQLHPMVARSFDICKQQFGTICLDEQDVFASAKQHTQLLKLVPDDSLRQELAAVFNTLHSSRDKWNKLTSVFKRYFDSGSLSRNTSIHLIKEIILQYTYPRLDIEVSKGMNHLLKAPFCAHPKTGRVCVPIDVENVDKFDPLSVPTLTELEKELNDALRGQEQVGTPDTSLTPYLQMFNDFVAGLKDVSVNKKECGVVQW